MFPNHNNYYYRPPVGFNFNPYLWDSQSEQGNSPAQFSQAQGPSQSSIQTVQTTTTSTSNDKPRAGPASWGSDQTATLVLSWKDNFEKIESTDNKAGWDAVLSKVNECGVKKTAKQCKDKTYLCGDVEHYYWLVRGRARGGYLTVRNLFGELKVIMERTILATCYIISINSKKFLTLLHPLQ